MAFPRTPVSFSTLGFSNSLHNVSTHNPYLPPNSSSTLLFQHAKSSGFGAQSGMLQLVPFPLATDSQPSTSSLLSPVDARIFAGHLAVFQETNYNNIPSRNYKNLDISNDSFEISNSMTIANFQTLTFSLNENYTISTTLCNNYTECIGARKTSVGPNSTPNRTTCTVLKATTAFGESHTVSQNAAENEWGHFHSTELHKEHHHDRIFATANRSQAAAGQNFDQIATIDDLHGDTDRRAAFGLSETAELFGEEVDFGEYDGDSVLTEGHNLGHHEDVDLEVSGPRTEDDFSDANNAPPKPVEHRYNCEISDEELSQIHLPPTDKEAMETAEIQLEDEILGLLVRPPPMLPDNIPDPETAGHHVLDYGAHNGITKRTQISGGSMGAPPEEVVNRWPIFSWGFSLAADVSPHRIYFDVAGIWDPKIYENIQHGSVVYVRTNHLRNFVEQILPNNPPEIEFTLLSGDSIMTVPDDLPPGVMYALISNEQITVWYAQNLGPIDHLPPEHAHKIRPLPLGNDFHTVFIRPFYWQMPRMHPWRQAEQILIAGSQIPLDRRFTCVHVSFQNTPTDKGKPWGVPGSSREWVSRYLTSSLPKSHVRVLMGKRSRIEVWRDQLSSAFVASVYGSGLDCHRTWEALQLGHIVLMLRTNHTSFWHMFDGLPVILLDDWAQVTPDNLRKWHACWAERLSDPTERLLVRRRLSLGYWMDKIRRGQ